MSFYDEKWYFLVCQNVNHFRTKCSLLIKERGLIAGKLLENEVGLVANLMIRSKHIHPARRVFLSLARFWCTREKGADYSQDGGCLVNTNRLPQGEANQITHENVEFQSNRAFTIIRNGMKCTAYCLLTAFPRTFLFLRLF